MLCFRSKASSRSRPGSRWSRLGSRAIARDRRLRAAARMSNGLKLDPLVACRASPQVAAARGRVGTRRRARSPPRTSDLQRSADLANNRPYASAHPIRTHDLAFAILEMQASRCAAMRRPLGTTSDTELERRGETLARSHEAHPEPVRCLLGSELTPTGPSAATRALSLTASYALPRHHRELGGDADRTSRLPPSRARSSVEDYSNVPRLWMSGTVHERSPRCRDGARCERLNRRWTRSRLGRPATLSSSGAAIRPHCRARDSPTCRVLARIPLTPTTSGRDRRALHRVPVPDRCVGTGSAARDRQVPQPGCWFARNPGAGSAGERPRTALSPSVQRKHPRTDHRAIGGPAYNRRNLGAMFRRRSQRAWRHAPRRCGCAANRVTEAPFSAHAADDPAAGPQR